MKINTILEEFKENEKLMNLMANSLGFSLEIIVTSNKTAILKLIRKGKKVITFDILEIEVKSSLQLIIKNGEEIITDALYYKYLLTFIKHYLYYKNVEFIYQFNGR